MRANHPPPFGLNQVFRTVAAGVASDPQGDSEEVGHVREAAMLGLHPRQRRSHVLLTLLRVGGGGGFNRTFQLYGTGNFVNLSTNKFNSIVIDSHSHFQFMFVSVYDLNKY